MTAAPALDLGSDPAADEERRAGLRRMRTLAVSLLLLAAAVYLLTLGEDGFLGFVNAGAEASMVGAIADWFAVTALFKHPLGIPVPHTALVPKRKEELGRSLQDFVGANFLQEVVIRDRIALARISERVGHWLVEPENSKRVVDEVAAVMQAGLARVRDEEMAALLRDAVLPRFREEPISPVAGSLLEEIVRDKAHHGLVDLALEEAHRWLVTNEETFTEVVGERAPWWSPQALNDRVTHRLHVEAVAWVEDIRRDPYHHARTALDSLLAQLADDLLHDESTQERAERLKERVLDHPQVLVTATSLWNAFRTALLSALADEDGALRHRALLELTRFGARLVTEKDLRDRLDGHAADLAVFAVGRYGDELTAVITHTVDRWDGKEAARRIELYVGRDLQFIRINGTLVGGLVGVLIHAVAVLVH
ncbi:MAG: DUF445 domain-containing protein [Actinomycetota bacterium]